MPGDVFRRAEHSANLHQALFHVGADGVLRDGRLARNMSGRLRLLIVEVDHIQLSVEPVNNKAFLVFLG